MLQQIICQEIICYYFFLEPTGSTTPNPTSTYITSHVDATVGGLDGNKFQDAVQEYFIKGLAWSTHKTYVSRRTELLPAILPAARGSTIANLRGTIVDIYRPPCWNSSHIY